jgi:hypothetical protein
MLLINCFNILFFFKASYNGRTETVEILIKNNANVNEKDNFEWTTLHFSMFLIERLFYYIIRFYSFCGCTQKKSRTTSK